MDTAKFGLILTDRCPIACRFCGAFCGPSGRNVMPRELMLEGIRQAAECSFETITFSGGEALLFPDLLAEGIQLAKSLGKKTSIVSNGFWGSWSDEKIRNTVGAMHPDWIDFSYDWFHKEFIPEDIFFHAVDSAAKFEITVGITISEMKPPYDGGSFLHSLSTRKFQREYRFGPAIRVGRATELDESLFYHLDDIPLSCHRNSVSLRYDGFVYPCCDFFVFDTALALGSLNERPLRELLSLSVVKQACTVLVEMGFLAWSVAQKSKRMEKKIDALGRTNSFLIDAINGVQKVKMSGSEKRAFRKWSESYYDQADASYQTRFPSVMIGELLKGVTFAGTLVCYIVAYRRNVPIASFMAFTSALGIVTSSVARLGSSLDQLANVKTVFNVAGDILTQTPENSGGRKTVGRLSGDLSLSHVSFSYDNSDRKIIDDLNLEIHSGEYVSIVGKSGCGKSTLMRLMLGFETPDSGAIYYSGREIRSMETTSFRRNLGVVIQDGRLFSGDIFSNITIAAPWLTEDDAWEVAEKAGIADDIRKMPMGMRTMISENGGGLSGGQCQRLLIARAIAQNPPILMLDEATSALDNITQKHVTDSLAGLECTRIVIAHRLSTVKKCERIIVLDGGKIIEEGTYDELMNLNGFFKALVERQTI